MLMTMDTSRALQYKPAYPTAATLWAALHKIHNDSSAANFLKHIGALTSLRMGHNESLLPLEVTRCVARASQLPLANCKKEGKEQKFSKSQRGKHGNQVPDFILRPGHCHQRRPQGRWLRED